MVARDVLWQSISGTVVKSMPELSGCLVGGAGSLSCDAKYSESD